MKISTTNLLAAGISAFALLLGSCGETPAGDKSVHSHEHEHQEVVKSQLIFPGHEPDRVILNVTEDPLHTLAVNWRTDTTIADGVVQYAIATHGPEFNQDSLITTIEASSEALTVSREGEPVVAAHYHAAELSGLQPGERYVYRVGRDPYWSEWYQVSMPSQDGPISFIYFGDAQNDIKSMWSRVVREAYHSLPKIDFMLHAGDLINKYDRDADWGEWFYAGSFIHAMVPGVMTPGNHEYHNGGAELSPQWRPQFNLPENGPKGLEETCYAINYPEMKVISLDAEQIDESETYRQAQVHWLDSVLTNDPRKWTVITFHYPVFSTKPNRDNVALRKNFKPLFDKHHVDLVLQGHDHAYGRGMVGNVPTGASLRDGEFGTVYVVSVSGPKMYDVSDAVWMDRKAGNTQLFQLITISGDTAVYQARTANGTLYDAFDLIKRPGKPNELINKIPDMPERKKAEE